MEADVVLGMLVYKMSTSGEGIVLPSADDSISSTEDEAQLGASHSFLGRYCIRSGQSIRPVRWSRLGGRDYMSSWKHLRVFEPILFPMPSRSCFCFVCSHVN